MPELPEVETILRQFAPQIISKEITGFAISSKGLKLIAPFNKNDFTKHILHKKIIEVKRIGKFLIFELDSKEKIVGHLRMTGRLIVSREKFKHQHKRLQLEFADNTYLSFIDIRRFATFHFVKKNEQYPGLKKLGIDALSAELTATDFYQRLQQKKKFLYSTLLDQSVVSGLGNIYVNELLFMSKLNPKIASNKLSLKQSNLLLINMRKILQNAINLKGTTLLDKTYLDNQGKEGKFYQLLKVYDRENKPCVVCKTNIVRIRIGGRSVYFCPHCQKLNK